MCNSGDMLDRFMMTFNGTVEEFEPNQEDWMWSSWATVFWHVANITAHSPINWRYSTVSLKCNYCNFCRILQFNILLCNQQHGNRLNESTRSRQNDADHHLYSISFMCIAVCLTCMHIELVECPNRLGP